MKQTARTIGLAALFSLAAGCGGSSSSSDGGSDDNTVSRNGQAIDGYLSDAQVCVDINFNAQCDDDEPTATTASDSSDRGEFTIEGIPSANRNAPTLVRAISGETVDQDTPDAPVSDDFNLRAPASARVVTPLTTLVQSRVDERLANDETATIEDATADAKEQVQQDLGVSSDEVDVLETDYVADRDSDDADQANAAQRVSATARATNRILQDARNRIQETTSSDNDAAVSNVAARRAQDRLSTVSADVSAAITAAEEAGEDSDPVSIGDSVGDSNRVESSEIEENETGLINEVAQEESNLEEVEDDVVEDDDTGDDTGDATGATGDSSG